MYDTYHMIRIQTSVIQYCTVFYNYSGLFYDTYFKRLLHWKINIMRHLPSGHSMNF